MTIWRKGMKAVPKKGVTWGYTASRIPTGFGPQEGEVVAVTSVHDDDGKTWLSLLEYKHYWNAANFRPAVTKKYDISIFQAMLNTTPAKERV